MTTLSIATFQPAARALDAQLPAYVAVSNVVNPNDLMALSPRIMQWEDDTWIVDLSVCASYWKVQALKKEMTVIDVLRTVLDHCFSNSDTCLDDGGAAYQAAAANHPWQAVLLLTCMKRRALSGLVNQAAPFGLSIFKEITWSVWWQATSCYAAHMEVIPTGKRKFNPSQFRSRSGQMQRAMKRLGLKAPWGLREMDPMQIKRRFGNQLHDLCQWAYVDIAVGNNENESLGGFSLQRSLFGQECDFPWASFTSPERPGVSRHLDYPVAEWAQIEPILLHDLDRLCCLDSFKAGERVVSLEWRIVFHDMSYLVIPIIFRHPHSLHCEMTRQCTALLQALYAFESSLRGSPLDKARLDDLIPIEPVVSWTLTVAERLILPSKLVGLFGDGPSANANGQSYSVEEQKLLEIENRLPVPLNAYSFRHDPLPEDSYATTTKEDPYEIDSKVFPTLAAQAQSRPLFLYRNPTALDSKSQRAKTSTFTERTLDKWWRTNGGSASRPIQRDYYHLTTHDQKAFWVYRANSKKQESFYIHGVFA
jgi:hypothetical protein